MSDFNYKECGLYSHDKDRCFAVFKAFEACYTCPYNTEERIIEENNKLTKDNRDLLSENTKLTAKVAELEAENTRMREALKRNKEQASKHYRALHICEASQACQGIYDRCKQILKGGE